MKSFVSEIKDFITVDLNLFELPAGEQPLPLPPLQRKIWLAPAHWSPRRAWTMKNYNPPTLSLSCEIDDGVLGTLSAQAWGGSKCLVELSCRVSHCWAKEP